LKSGSLFLGLELIFSALAENKTINILDLSQNRLDDACGRMIGAIISQHGQRRDEVVWAFSLRGEPPGDIDMKGKFYKRFPTK